MRISKGMEADEILNEAIWAISTKRIPELCESLQNILPDEMEKS